MTAIHSSPPHPIPSSPYGRTPRHSPLVQALQSAPSYIDIYTGSPLARVLNTEISPQFQHQTVSHAHPDHPPRWQGPRGFGGRHVNDTIPFSLWDEDTQDFRNANMDEMRLIQNMYKSIRLSFDDYLLIIETSNPPKPVTLTVACMPAIFVPSGYVYKHVSGSAPYVGPRVKDPCPHLSWGRMQAPGASQMANVVSVLLGLANVERVHFLPTSIVVELIHGDGRVYADRSLPATLAGLWTSYHHSPVPFFSALKDHTRERLLDPSKHIPESGTGQLPQDKTNYLREPSWRTLTPGMRVSSGSATTDGEYSTVTRSTTCGIYLRKGSSKCMTAAYHGFQTSNEVHHPTADGDKIGDIIHRYPALDVALVQLTPAFANRFSNNTYFQAEPPKRLVDTLSMKKGTWFEVDGMSTGLISFQFLVTTLQRPIRPPGHPEIPALQWRRDTTFRIFGATSPDLLDGLCGAPFVEVETGNVAGFFHMANGDYAVCAALDDLVAEGWEVA